MKKIEMSNTVNTLMKAFKDINVVDVDVVVYGESVVDDGIDPEFVGMAATIMGFSVEDVLAVGGLPGVLEDPLAVANVTADGYAYNDVLYINASLNLDHNGKLAAVIVVHVDEYNRELTRKEVSQDEAH